jgi:hypothetical protein
VALALTALGWSTVTSAQTSTPERVEAAVDQASLAKQTQNPVSSLISVPLQGNWDFGLGDRDATGTILNIQPVIPFPITKSTNNNRHALQPHLVGERSQRQERRKVAVLGKRPVNFQVAAGPTVASPDEGASWRFRLTATFMYPR